MSIRGRRGGASSVGKKEAQSKPSFVGKKEVQPKPSSEPLAPKKGDRDIETKEEVPLLQFALRTDQSASIISAPPPLSSVASDLQAIKDREADDSEEQEGQEGSTYVKTIEVSPREGTFMVYSADGTLFAAGLNDKVNVYDVKETTLKLRHSLGRPNVERIEFSPLNSFLVTWEGKHQKGVPNMYIWDLSTGEIVKEFHEKEEKQRGQWPPFAWTSDEKLFAHVVTNQINIYDGKDFTDRGDRLKYENVCQFSIAPGEAPYTFAVARLARHGQPGKVSIFSSPKFDKEIANKTFFNADEITLKWSAKGVTPAALLIETSTQASGSSYYGESNLYLIHANGKFDCTVPFGADVGQIQDAQWSPVASEFVVIQGKQPAQAILFRSDDCKPIHHFGRFAINTIRWNPQGRFILLGGFGNCPGNLFFWDRNKKKQIGQTQDRHAPRFFDWTADGRHFITATLRPKRTVDIGYKIWTYYAKLISHTPIDRLCEVSIRPAPAGTYPDRPPSPSILEAAGTAAQKAKSPEGTVSKAYIPPSLRKLGAGPSNIMKTAGVGPRTLSELEKQIQVGSGQTVVPGAGSVPPPSSSGSVLRTNYVPGQGKPQVLSKTAQKRKNKKKKAEEEAKKAEEAKKEESRKPKSPTVDTTDKDAVSKRLKNLKKKMRQIEEIKEKLKKGEKVDAAQQEKIDAEDELQTEIESLEKVL